MLNYKTFDTNRIILIILFALLMNTGVHADDITNPLLSYSKIQSKSKSAAIDSTITTKLFFNNIPEYGKVSKITIEHHALFSTENDLIVKAQGNSIVRKELQLEQYSFTFPGPITEGEILVGEFYLKPLKVGKLDLSFIIYDNVENRAEKTRILISGYINIVFELSTNGNTKLMALSQSQNITNKSGLLSGIFGPDKSQFSKHLYFSKNPIISDPIYASEIRRKIDIDSRYFPFAIDFEISPNENDNSLFHVDCKLQSYYSFVDGIGFDVKYTKNLEILNMSPSINEQIIKNNDYLFSFDFRVLDSGLSFFKINFSTPKTGEYKNFEKIYSHEKNISDGLVLYIGTNENNEVEFITDKHPSSLKKHSGADNDNRKRFVESYDLKKKLNKITGENYNEIFSKLHSEKK